MRRWMKIGIAFVLTSAMIFFGIFLFKIYEIKKNQESYYEDFDRDNWVNPLETAGISENLNIYKEDEQLNVNDIYITVLKSKNNDDGKDFKGIMTSTEDSKSSKAKVEIFFTDGSKKILENGIFIREPNATIEIRGKSSEKALQKSFKIRLFDREGLWHNQNIINLNKHFFDNLRIRNKLSFDYFKIIPNITSLRTSFVRLFIRDLSSKNSNDKFIDYGFFTQIEQPNKLFLKNHGLDPNGHLYKAENFKFLRYPENIKNKKDSTFSKKNFEEILEIRGDENHQKLISMLEAVNDYNNDINEVVETHFDRENFLTWVAVNILFDNYEKINTDFLIYSPLNSNKWYFMPWNFDEAWGLDEDRPKWQKGLSMFWDNVLFKRFFKDTENVKALNKKIEELSTIVNKKQTKVFLESYYDIVMANITKLPDLKYFPIVLDQFDREYEELSELTERNKLYYYELLENPMPFHLKGIKYKENKYTFVWEKTYDVHGDDLYYDFELSKDKNFSIVIKTVKDIKDTKYELENLDNGIYYWRVRVKDIKGNSQIAYNIFKDQYGDKYYGIKQLIIDDGMDLSTFEEESIETEIIDDVNKKTMDGSDNEIIVIRDDSVTIESIKISKENESKVPVEEDKSIESQIHSGQAEKEQDPKTSYETYTLKSGENLYLVSMKIYGHKGMIEAIRKLNGIQDINNIPIGTKLKLPPKSNVKYQTEIPEVYRLKPGDTLYSVSIKFYGTKEKIEEIRKLNNIKDIYGIPTGMTLKLPRD